VNKALFSPEEQDRHRERALFACLLKQLNSFINWQAGERSDLTWIDGDGFACLLTFDELWCTGRQVGLPASSP